MNTTDLRRKTPIMGWASWNCFRTHINEEVLKKQADLLVSTGLAACGYEYFNIDDGFFGGRDDNGRLQMHKERFPNGIKVVADYAHSLGLKAGIYSDAGDNTCGHYYDREGDDGRGVGLYGYEEQDLRMYLVEFGFDFIKVDWCGGLRLGLDEKEQYSKIGRIVDKIRQETGRSLVYNICRWQFPGTWAAEVSDSWRTAADIAPVFGSVLHQIDNIKPLAKYCGPGHINDLDMMQIGNGLSTEEEKTHFAMWCMMSTPLMIGCDLSTIKPETLAILKNTEMISINQDSACMQAFVTKELRADDGKLLGEVWVKYLGEKNSCKKAIAFLNRSEEELNFANTKEELGLGGTVKNIRDVWKHGEVSEAELLKVTVKPHDVVVFVAESECDIELADLYEDSGVDIEGVEKETTPFLTREEADRLIKEGAVLADARERKEYDKWHFDGAINLQYTAIHFDAMQLKNKEVPIILYCRTGKRSEQSRQTLRYLGFKNVYCMRMAELEK